MGLFVLIKIALAAAKHRANLIFRICVGGSESWPCGNRELVALMLVPTALEFSALRGDWPVGNLAHLKGIVPLLY
jgi:hypothetical protein